MDVLRHRFPYNNTESGRVERASFYGPDREGGAPVKDGTRMVGDWLAYWRPSTFAATARRSRRANVF